MPFDKDIRNTLANVVVQCRRLLIRDVTEQLQETFGIQPDGTALPLHRLTHLNEDQLGQAQALREILAHYSATAAGSAEEITQSAYDRMVLEMAFTALNRLAALRLCEERGLLHECIRSGMASEGFQLFDRLAAGALGTRFEAYKVFLSFLFDELSVDLGILFDRSSPQSLIFPRERCLEDVLALLNQDNLKGVWIEDETIGWIYQYFNPSEERKAMREASAAPRNSRELAVRNQFFTPRYVVEFLTDNTLGRIWYEMNRGETRLKDQCRYLVRRPNEIFLQPGEAAPEQPQQDNLSQEELLRQPVYISHRPLKDPREILMLDPACGSMHFGLYAFDLFEVIYEEAWEIAHGNDEARKSSPAFASFIPFVAQYHDKAAFLADVPRLIIEHNIHGIDIDPRCVQISALSLWLRAQRSWQKQGLRPQDRPRIRRSNIVCAEPMPGEESFLNEFIEQHLAAVPERKLLGQLARRVFDAMKLAGEAGSLLKIEEEIAGAVAEAKQKWLAAPKPEQGGLFADETTSFTQKERHLDLTGITDETFWEKVEERIYGALQTYAEQAEHGGYQRRLFADDAAHGFAFIDLCRKRYDVVLMNPPFGEDSKRAKDWIAANYPRTRQDLLASFCERGLDLLLTGGILGEISSRVAFFLKSFERWRSEILGVIEVKTIVDLGSGVLDDAMVEAASYVLLKREPDPAEISLVLRLVLAEDKGTELLGAISDHSDSRRFLVSSDHSRSLPHSPLIYWLSRETIEALASHPSLEPHHAVVRQGLGTGDNNRFVRAAWEIPPEKVATAGLDVIDFRKLFDRGKRWAYHVRSGSSQPWYSPLTLVIDWEGQGARLKELWRHKGETPSRYVPSEDLYFRPGFSWTLRAFRFIPYVIPSGCIPSASRYMAFPHPSKEIDVLALCASNLASAFMRFYGEKFEYPKHLVDTLKRLPCIALPQSVSDELASLIAQEVSKRRNHYRNYEPFVDFILPTFVKVWTSTTSSGWNPKTFLGHDLELKVANSFGMKAAQLAELESDLLDAVEACTRHPSTETNDEGDEGESETEWDVSAKGQRTDLLSYAVGCASGRWDIRYATGDKPAPELPDPFAPLPVCPPGQLQNEQRLPITKEDTERLKEEGHWNYPIDIPWDGILVDESGHPLDIEARIREVLQIIWKDRWEAIEREACEILGVTILRDYFRKPTAFFADHLKRYSKSRRQAPIYWPLSTASGSYTIWLYYHRLSDDTLYTVVNRFVDPKIASVERDIARLEFELAGTSGRDASRARGKIEEANSLLNELREFREEMLRIAGLPYKPNLNDGVIINASPFHRLFRLRSWAQDTEEIWRKLERGEYDWAHLAYTIWPDRVREVCKRDRSIAIAHGMEELYEGPVQPVRLKRTKQKAAYPSEPELPYAKVAEEVPRSMDAKGRILAALRGAAEPLGKSQLIEAAGIADSAWSPAMRALKDEGLVEQIGEKRNAVYRIKEGR